MNSHKKDELALALDKIRKKHGTKIITKAGVKRKTSYIPFGFSTLDNLIGGVPHGQVTEIIGKPTSGATTLALNVMHAAQNSGSSVVYVDLASTFDADYATRLGLKNESLLVVRPEIKSEALDILFDIATSGVPGVITLNSVTNISPKHQNTLISVIERLNPLLTRYECALILIKHAESDGVRLSQYSDLRLKIEVKDWLQNYQDISGYEVQVTILKNKSGNEGRKLLIRMPLGAGNTGEIA